MSGAGCFFLSAVSPSLTEEPQYLSTFSAAVVCSYWTTAWVFMVMEKSVRRFRSCAELCVRVLDVMEELQCKLKMGMVLLVSWDCLLRAFRTIPELRCWAGRQGYPYIIKPPTQVQGQPTFCVIVCVCGKHWLYVRENTNGLLVLQMFEIYQTFGIWDFDHFLDDGDRDGCNKRPNCFQHIIPADNV